MAEIKQRNIVEVINKMITEIPEGHPVVPMLQKIANDSVYCAPEAMYTVWHKVATVLNIELGNPRPDTFQWRVLQIFSGKD
jgi:hypothetical protein